MTPHTVDQRFLTAGKLVILGLTFSHYQVYTCIYSPLGTRSVVLYHVNVHRFIQMEYISTVIQAAELSNSISFS